MIDILKRLAAPEDLLNDQELFDSLIIERPPEDKLSYHRHKLSWLSDDVLLKIFKVTAVAAPIIGAVCPLMEDTKANQLRVHPEVHCRIFDLSDLRSRILYSIILQRAQSGWYKIEDKVWAEEGKQIQLTWTQRYISITPVETDPVKQ